MYCMSRENSPAAGLSEEEPSEEEPVRPEMLETLVGPAEPGTRGTR
jgi:hypothetical protein